MTFPQAGRWGAAFLVSAAIHFGIAALLFDGGEEVAIAGGSPTEIAILGNAFEDASTVGDVSRDADAVEPEKPAVETEAAATPETGRALKAPPERVLAQKPETLAPQNPVTAERAVRRMPDSPRMTNEKTSPIAPAPANEAPTQRTAPATQRAEIAISANTAGKAEATKPATVQPSDPQTADQTSMEKPQAADPPSAPIAAVVPQEAPAELEMSPISPETFDGAPGETIAELPAIPLPTARPDPPKKTAEHARKPEPKRETVRKAKPSAGQGGPASRDQKRGASNGGARGSATAGERKGNSRQAGNAAVSNYPGKIVRKLRRALRYPSSAKRKGISGEVHVRFTVARNGGVTGMRVVRSSGSPILDRAALDTVRRAAPFPKIPDGRSSWPFTVPLAFSR